MQTANIRNDEWAGLGVAVALHLGLVGFLIWQPAIDNEQPVPLPETISVSLADDVGLSASAPVPVRESRASMGPVLSDVPAPSVGETVPLTRSEPVARSTQPSTNRAEPARTPATRRETTRTTERRTEAPTRSSATSNRATASTARSGGASREFSQAFDGAGSSTTSNDARPPASSISGAAKSSLLQNIARKLKPHWDAPEGADAEQLYTLVSFRLNEDGSLNGTPQCKATQGVTPANQSQASTHCRYAIRAIRAAAPFSLPDRFYNAWKRVNDFKFSGTL